MGELIQSGSTSNPDDTFTLTLFKMLSCYEIFSVTNFLPLLLECSEEIVLTKIRNFPSSQRSGVKIHVGTLSA